MLVKENLNRVLENLGYKKSTDNLYTKKFEQVDCEIKVDFDNGGSIIYPEDKGMKITRRTTCNFSDPENFVVLECVSRLLDKGYRPENIELERAWTLGHEQKSGRADICVTDSNGRMLFIVECKTFGTEYSKEMKNTLSDGGQLFSYWQQEKGCRWLILYSSTLNNDDEIEYVTDSIDCSDDENILNLAKKDSSIRLYKNAHTVSELYTVWKETYEQRFSGDIIFRDDSIAYKIGVKPLRKKDLKDFSENNKVVNRFEEILRHNNVSDKENAFNRLIALFICKLVDEIQKTDDDIVEFQYKVGTDTYESLQDRLQRLHKDGMEKFMREKIFYVSDDYAENLVKQYTKQKRVKMIEELKNTLRILKFYTNNDFAFKDVHNEELFYQNGKILVEMVQLFQDYRIIGSADIQMLGDLFEQLLNKGFKQNEGQFFTPTPITRFIWDSLPLEAIMRKPNGIEYPKMIDYACGAGHFLTEGFEAVEVYANSLNNNKTISSQWVEKSIYGIEKDYRLARVSKISLFMHGAGDGNIIFGDGLENYPDKNIESKTFDILVANPPYSVKSFKPHLKLANNSLNILEKISNDGSEIETLFVERIAQLLKPNGVAAVVLPSSILNKENESFVAARESLLENFKIKAIVTLGSKTFGATGTNTVILFLQKYNEPPKRIDMVSDSINAIFSNANIDGWEDEVILRGYLKKINVKKETYRKFISKEKEYNFWKSDEYFKQYVNDFVSSGDYKKKSSQRNFIKLSPDEKIKWFNQHFYEFVFSIEHEKLFYYSLIYNQQTLIISAPEGNKEQEKFLGYKWSNRKGQEGIQIIKPGGLLYNDINRFDDNTLAGLIRNTFLDNEMNDINNLSDYYYTLRLQDMIDFSNVTFNKAIKTTPTRVLKDIQGLTNYRLSDKTTFDLSIGNRVLSDEVVPNGSIPIYSANVFEEFGRTNKQNITDFSLPSIIWGIDGDWMVNIIPKNQPFYPTDHCGVLRIKNNNILPEYFAIALQVEGKYERFSRSNRASTQRISNLVIQIPSVADQQKVVDEIGAIDKKIADEQAIIREQSEKINSKFTEMFGNAETNDRNWQKASLRSIAIEDLSYGSGEASSPYDNKIRYIRITDIDQYGNLNDDKMSASFVEDKYMLHEGDILFARSGATVGKTYLYHEKDGKCLYAGYLIRLIPNTTKVTPEYVFYFTKTSYYEKFVADTSLGNTAQANINAQQYSDLQIMLPPLTLQENFSIYVKSCDKLKFVAQKRMEELNIERKELIDKYFR